MEGLYAIVDVPHPHGLAATAVTAAVLRGGAQTIQLRAKTATSEERIALLTEMAPLCSAAGVPLIMNDDVEAAFAAADGVHLGQDDLPRATDLPGAGRADFRVGISTHNPSQLQAAAKLRPDYLAMGPIGPTRSKENPDPTVGFTGLLEACRLATRPLVAIGGLDVERGARAIGIGASAVAVISALHAPTREAIEERARELADAFAEAAKPLPFSQVIELIPVLPPDQLADIARWGDDVGTHVTLGLPARFRPHVDGDTIAYRRSDVLDLAYALGKRPDESWESWAERMENDEGRSGTLVQLRKR